MRKEIGLKSDSFRELNISERNTVQRNIEDKFLYQRSSNVRRIWLWDDLKMESFGVACDKDPYTKLDLLVSENEKVYFLVNETINELTKYWCYEGKVESILSVIGESYGLDEYYLISKKYEWFLCTNHHDVLIGARTIIPLMKEYEKELKEAKP